MREEVARGLACKGEILWKLNRLEEALAAYEEVAHRYSEAPEAPVRERVAEALNDAGVVLIFEAKRLWAQKRDQALAFLERASAKIAASLERQPRGPTALWNAGYIAFLQGKRDQARSLLAESLQLGGERQRSRGLQGGALAPIPEDEELRALVGSL